MEAPVRMDHHERMKIRAAAFRATRVYPGPAGQILSKELLSWEEYGWRLGSASLILSLVDQIMKAELPAFVAA